MAVFLVNVGNTHTQVSNDNFTSVETMKSADFISYAQDTFKADDKLYIASVVKEINSLVTQLDCESHFLSWQDLEVNFKKVTPDTIGADRLANIAVAKEMRGNVLVLDCGTCITAEFVSENGTFDGGFIMPGRNLSRKALNSFTSQLPEVPLSDHYILLGKNTDEAIQSGIDTMSGLALQKYTEELAKMYTDLKVVLTGGDADFYKKFISCKYQEEDLMTLKGLRTVFINNS